MDGKHDSGKGDTYRKINADLFRKNYEAIFGEKPIKIWSPEQDKNENISIDKSRDSSSTETA